MSEWSQRIPLLTFSVIITFLRYCKCNSTDSSICNFVSTEKPPVLKQPKLLVFSLDLVIWPFCVDNDIVTPVKKNKRTGRVHDFVMKTLGVYGDAVDALNTLYLKNYRMAAVSNSPDVETNTKLLLYFNLYNYFPIQEIFSGSKKEHLEVIHRSTQIPFEDIFYFDVSNDQLGEVKQLGTQVIEVSSGLEIHDFNKALDIYNKINMTKISN